MKAPATLDEFYRTFRTEQRCWEALRRLRWPNGFRCPRCKGRKAYGRPWPPEIGVVRRRTQ